MFRKSRFGNEIVAGDAKDTLPTAFGREVDEMSTQDKLLFLFSGPEWMDIYKACVKYMHIIYRARVKLHRLHHA